MENNSEGYYIGEKQSEKPSQCTVCGAESNTVEYSLSKDSGNDSAVMLCPEHEQLFAILGRTDSPTPARSIDESAQQTRKITVRLPKALLESADASAESQGQTRSDLVRDAVQIYIELSEVNLPADDLLSQAASQTKQETNQTHDSDVDVAFLKERIRRLEALLDDSIEKI